MGKKVRRGALVVAVISLGCSIAAVGPASASVPVDGGSGCSAWTADNWVGTTVYGSCTSSSWELEVECNYSLVIIDHDNTANDVISVYCWQGVDWYSAFSTP